MSEWVENDPPVICETCSRTGPHFRVEDMLYCGNCNNEISDGWQD